MVKGVSGAVIQLVPHRFTITGQWTPAVNFNGERGKRCSHTTRTSSLYHHRILTVNLGGEKSTVTVVIKLILITLPSQDTVNMDGERGKE